MSLSVCTTKKAWLSPQKRSVQYSGKVNLNTEINDWLRAGVNVALSLEDRKPTPIVMLMTGLQYVAEILYAL